MLAKLSSVCLALLLLATPAWAQATGSVVGPFSCTFLWDLPTNLDGTPLAIPPTSYKMYIQQVLTPAPIPGVTNAAFAVTGTPPLTSANCTGTPTMVVGQNYAWVTAVYPAGESALSAVLPFTWALVKPVPLTPPPTGLRVQ